MNRILITNDDGVHHPGLQALEKSIQPHGEITVVAPSHEMSAASRALTLIRPLRIEKIDGSHFAIDGTPVDCITLAMGKIMSDHPPDLIVSGINHGANLGDDILYSGTVAGAAEAAVYGLPGIAFSLERRGPPDYRFASEIVSLVIEKVLREGMPLGTILNVNIPQRSIRGIRLTRQGRRALRPRITEGRDPRGREYYWIGIEQTTSELEKGTDYEAFQEGYVSITPLQSNLTNYSALEMAASWNALTYEYQPLESWAT